MLNENKREEGKLEYLILAVVVSILDCSLVTMSFFLIESKNLTRL